MPTSHDKTHVLYLHAQSGFMADSTIHAHFMRHLDRERFVVHVAYTRGEGQGRPASALQIEKIPDVRLFPMSFVPGLRERSASSVLRAALVGSRFPLDFARLARYVRRERIRIIHSTDRPRDSAYAVLLGRLTGAKSVVHVHVKWTEGYSALAKWAVANADAAFGISRFVSDSIVAMGKPASRVHTVLNSVETSQWDPTRSGGAVRQEFGIPPEAPLVVAVSRLFAEKGYPELLAAFALVRRELPGARLLIAGAETPFSRGYQAQLEALAGTLGIAGAVVFAGSRSDIPEVMAASDVFALPSFEEPFGLVYLEAMAMQRPVVAVDNGGTPEVVEHGKAGLLSPYKDVPALAENLLTLLRDPARRAEMGRYGRARVLEYFDTKRMADDAAAAYDAILNGA